MAIRNYTNAPATTLNGAVTNVATTIVVASVTGLPISYPYVLILDRGGPSEEVVLVTGGAGTSLTVTRGYDSTTAFAHANGAVVEHGISAIDPREANAHVNASSAVHGVAGSVVGTSDAQTLTNKTISADDNTINGLATTSFVYTDGAGALNGSGGTKAIPLGTVVGTSDTQTLTNKTVTLGSNTVSGTKAQFNNAMTDADFATIDGAETLTNKTLDTPTITGVGAVKRAIKTATENVSSSTTLQDDDHLSFTLEPGTWMLDAVLFTNSASDTPDIKVSLSFSGTETYTTYGVIAPTVGSTSLSNTSMKVASTETMGSAIPFGVISGGSATNLLRGAVVVTVAGTLTLKWAQDTSSATSTALVRGSWLRAERVA